MTTLKHLVIPVIAGLRKAAERRNPRTFLPASVRSLALVELTGLGDAVTTITLIRNLQDAMPQARIHLFVDLRFAGLIGLLSGMTTVHGVRRSRTPAGVVAAIKEIRKLDIDLACSISPAHRNALVVLSSRAPFKAGYLRTGGSDAPSLRANPLDGFGFIPHQRLEFRREGWLERRWKVLRLLGLAPGRMNGHESMPEDVKEASLATWRRRGVLNGRPHIVIHPFSSWHYRSWPARSYIGLIERVLKEWNLDVIVVCEEKEAERLREFRTRFHGSERVHCVASRDLVETAVLVEAAAVLVGNDSGLVHLAATVGTPAVGVYGPSDPDHTAPGGVVPVYRKLDCSPCEQQCCVRKNDSCMTYIPVDEVFVALRGLLVRKDPSWQR